MKALCAPKVSTVHDGKKDVRGLQRWFRGLAEGSSSQCLSVVAYNFLQLQPWANDPPFWPLQCQKFTWDVAITVPGDFKDSFMRKEQNVYHSVELSADHGAQYVKAY